MSTDTPTPTERRGYPLPPWARAESPAEHTGADTLEYLLDLLSGEYGLDRSGMRQAEAYLDAWLTRHREAQDTASRCHIEDHDSLKAELAEARAAVYDAYRAGYSHRNDELTRSAAAGTVALYVVVAIPEDDLDTVDPAYIADRAYVEAKRVLERQRAMRARLDTVGRTLDDVLADDELDVHVCGEACR